jgi:hypothetical protein
MEVLGGVLLAVKDRSMATSLPVSAALASGGRMKATKTTSSAS